MDMFTYGRDSNASSTLIVTSLNANGAANRSPEMNWELISLRTVTSRPLKGPLTSTSSPRASEIEWAEAPSALIPFTSGCNGLLVSLRLPLCLTAFRHVEDIAVRNVRVDADRA